MPRIAIDRQDYREGRRVTEKRHAEPDCRGCGQHPAGTLGYCRECLALVMRDALAAHARTRRRASGCPLLPRWLYRQ